MSGAAMTKLRFFLISGIILLVAGLIQLFTTSNMMSVEGFADQLSEELQDNATEFRDWAPKAMEGTCPPELPAKGASGIYLAWEADSLVCWTDNLVLPSPTQVNQISDSNQILHLKNGWYQAFKLEKESKKLVYLIPIRMEYSFTNRYLKNHFHTEAHLPEALKIATDPAVTSGSTGEVMVDGRVVALLYGKLPKTVSRGAAAGVILIALSCILLTLSLLIALDESRLTGGKRVAVFGVYLLLLRLVFLFFHFPAAALPIPLFDPMLLAIPLVAGSLGELTIHVLFLLVFLLWLYPWSKDKVIHSTGWNASVIFLSFLLLAGVVSLSKAMVVNSTLELNIANFSLLNGYSYLTLLILLLLWGCLGVWTQITLNFLGARLGRPLLVAMVLGSLACCALLYLNKLPAYLILIAVIWQWLFYAYAGAFQKDNRRLGSYGGVIGWLLLLAVPPGFSLYQANSDRLQLQQVAYAEKMVEERDWYLELALESMAISIKQDPYVQAVFTNPYLTVKDLRKRLINLHFGGEFSRFDLDVHAFNPSGFQIKSSTEILLDEYQNQINKFGEPTPSEYFFYVDPPNAPYKYMGLIPVSGPEKFLGNLVLDCRPKIYQSNNVYPELLLQGTSLNQDLDEKFATLIVENGIVTGRKGEIPENLFEKVDTASLADGTYEWNKIPGRQTVFLKSPAGKLIIVSANRLEPKTILTYFSYLSCLFLALFAIYYLLSIFWKGLLKPAEFRDYKGLSLRGKINLALISVVLVSFLIIGLVTIRYFMEEYETYHRERLLRKQEAVLSDLSSDLFNSQAEDTINRLDEVKDFLKKDVIELSVIHSMDINFFDSKGDLVASSQPTIFEEGIIATKISPKALNELRMNPDLLVMDESIGHLEYLSAYEPLYSRTGDLLGYLNLPYFARERNLDRDISSFMVTLVNAYVLLLIATGFLALMISRGVNRSLQSIAEKLSRVNISGQNEPIQVESSDEIGQLVAEYNKMILELERSAKKLAESERETAWREMAKQIAHEIKNPLTPMKLSIQHLQRALNDEDPGAGELAKRVSKTLIEQIDNLSEIATAFSSFAKMPKPSNEELDLVSLLDNVVELFRDESTGTRIEWLRPEKEILVFADKKQLLSVFNNLLKNAQQAVPDSREAEIAVRIEIASGKVIVMVTDNGTGIHEDFKSKVFVPNFTTKSSGTGLGLAIARRIVEQADGKIWFETLEGEGTTFFVQLPLLEDN